MERYYIIRDPSDWPALSGTTTTTTTTSDDDDENDEDANSTITCQFCSRRRGGGCGVEGGMNKKKYPAVYYEIEILRGSGSAAADGNDNNNSSSATSIDATAAGSKKVYRRYSQFDALLRRVDPRRDKKYDFPPKTYMLDSWRSTDVLDERMVGLYDFLCNIILSQQQLEYGNGSNVDGGGGGVNSSRCIIGNFLEIS